MLDVQQAPSSDQETRDLISNALEKMPNFSSEIQSNNVLTKRILALKVKDGLHIDMHEAERDMQTNMKRLSMQPANPTDKQIDDIIKEVSSKGEDQAQPASSMGDLLELGGP